MSCNRENVVWQRQNGTWCVGFYDFYPTGDTSDPDWDYEWDVEYTDTFMWAKEGLPSEDEACAAWSKAGNSNPGGHSIYPWSEEDQSYIEHFEKLLSQLKGVRC